MIEKKPKCVKLYDGGIGLFIVLAMFFGFGVWTMEKASGHAKHPVTKQNLTEAVSPIKPAKTYND